MTTLGTLIADILERNGVEYVFGIPGESNIGLYVALRNSKITHVTTRHEQGAALMADGYSRCTGKVGVCLTTAGPGATNALTAVAQSYSNSVPILLLSADIPSDAVGKHLGVSHETDLMSIFRPVTRLARRVTSPADLRDALHDAFDSFHQSYPKPVAITIPRDLFDSNVRADSTGWKPKQDERTDGTSSDLLDAASDLIAKAGSPLIIANEAVINCNASKELSRLAETIRAPTVTTIGGKGAVPEDHAFALGTFPFNPLALDAIRNSDLILLFGSSTSSIERLGIPSSAKIIQIDPDSSIGELNPSPAVCLYGNPKTLLTGLQHRLARRKRSNLRSVEGILGLKARAATNDKFLHSKEAQAVKEIRDSLDRGAVVAVDIFGLCRWMVRYFQTYEPRTFLYPDVYSSMGYAFPASLGAKLAKPEKQVLSVCGDGGFMMTCSELSTAVALHLNVVVLVVNNNAYGIIADIQRRRLGFDNGVNLTNPDFGTFTRSFGAEFIGIDSVTQIHESLNDAFSRSKPMVIELRVPLHDIEFLSD